MARLLSPDGACVGIDVGERRYNGTVLEVTDPAHISALKQVGYTTADIAGRPVQTDGRKCAECGFRAFFATCGRCGGRCERVEG
jgi:hypothetical protein